MKNETKHTLETWHVDKNDPRLCLPGTKHFYTVYRQTVEGKDIIREAVAENVAVQDARLIAAAPELLNLLIDGAEMLEKLTGENLAVFLRTFAALANVAIEKATGKGEA